MTFDLSKIDWTAIGSIGTFLAVWVALHQSSSAARAQRTRNASVAGKIAVLHGRAYDLLKDIIRRIDAKEKWKEIGEGVVLIGAFPDLIHAAENISLADIEHPLVADELVRGRTGLKNAQQIATLMVRGKVPAPREAYETLLEAFADSQGKLMRWYHWYRAPLWKRLINPKLRPIKTVKPPKLPKEPA